ncbi:DUF6751 family protein [Clostridium cellulovorans]|uniref:Uncharacterized protein n=1 Tax=Clostridium cellulovorans (strain ATCC 35296 / DSM 3052 / OCM 3 / 743B) TaxID=573061 RepID=D9SWD3_CLOC7|nr:DUF6751 family protein [Clostridium cellulovorans]ADL53215.1 hypothetical protein Clocel_3539 [Clostridium cellulovorans 743B]
MAVLFPNTSITIYNHYFDNANNIDKYKRTVIEGCDWKGKRNSTVSDKGLLLADSVLIFVNKSEKYISPKHFRSLSDAKRTSFFTFSIGDKIVKGEVSFEITGTKPFSLADLDKNFDEVITIKSANTNLSGHYEIEGV